MANTFVGTHDITALLVEEHTTAFEYGLDNLAQILQADLAGHNASLEDAIASLADVSADRVRRAGAGTNAQLMEADEYARGTAQRSKGGADVGFPLKKFIDNQGWTLDYLKVATPADLARRQIAMEKAHRQAVLAELRRAIFIPTNYTFFDDLVAPTQDLPVKRLLNADDFPIPDGPHGETFDGSTHTHYDANNGWTSGAVDAQINNVLEHFTDADVKVVVASTNVSDISTLTPFVAATPTFVQPVGETDATAQRFTNSRSDNRIVGYWRGNYEVWSKPWGLANYPAAINFNAPERALVYRQRAQAALRGLRMRSSFEMPPLQFESWEAEFGFGVWGRAAAAVTQMNNETYEVPNI